MNTQLPVSIQKAICLALFGMTLEDFIAEAKRRAGANWKFIEHGNDFENALDWVSLKALQEYNALLDDLTDTIILAPRRAKTGMFLTLFRKQGRGTLSQSELWEDKS